MRTTEDLIEELKHNGEGYDAAALAVGFESTTVFVWLHDPEPLAKLNDAVMHGGEPIGWVRLKAGARMEMGVLEEYKAEPWAHDYIKTLGSAASAMLKGAN